MKRKFPSVIIPLSLLAIVTVTANAATTFVTTTLGNAAALQGDGAGDSAPLNLGAADGGGTINVNTIGVFNGTNPQTLGMTDLSMGVGNEKWGNTAQRWLFSFDQTVDFDALGFGGTNQGMKIESVAWKDDANASGSNWSFTSNGSLGTFSFFSGDGPTFDFTSAGVSSVAAGTQITIEHVSGAGGSRMESFTITPIPEPSSAALLGLGALGLLFRRRRK